MEKIEVYQNEKKQYFWRLVAENGKTVADGSEGYHNKQDLMNELQSIKNKFAAAPIVEK
jgi:uncharacterized protein YegP (UPF0339 family)